MKINDLVELSPESIGFEGVAVARKDNLVYFIKNALPGDKILARVISKKSSYVTTKTEQILEHSPDRIEHKCSHFGVCGGCSWQNLNYQRQLFWKKQNVIDSFQRIAKINSIKVLDPVPSPEIFHYRNKMEFSFGDSRWITDEEIKSNEVVTDKHFALGLHIPGMFNKVLQIDKCYIQPDEANDSLNILTNYAKRFQTKAYNLKNHKGFLRNLIVRKSFFNNELMLILITTSVKEDSDNEFLNFFKNKFPPLTKNNVSIIHAINDTYSPVHFGDFDLIKGKDYLLEEIHDVKFRISPFSFFQTNTLQLEKFVTQIIDIGTPDKEMIGWDFYCGAGTITLPASKHLKKIYGFELNVNSVNDAKSNAVLNNVENSEFFCVDLNKKENFSIIDELPKPDIIFIDPPRAGIHKNLIAKLLSISAEKIVYVSCNPATMARDCAMLSDKYDIEKIIPIDMFPHTYHIESIGLLNLK